MESVELRLGDLMRGERATKGKTLEDVQNDLRIRAAYISAIENADPDAFDTPGFVAGYVRSYARYLNMDPEWAFETFCRESGFSTAHGMSDMAKSRPVRDVNKSAANGADIFAAPVTPFVPQSDSMFSRIEPGAIGSTLVLLLLIGGLGYGGWTVMKEVQQVQIAPATQSPIVVADVDPLQAATETTAETNAEELAASSTDTAPTQERLERLYRPQTLDVPVMVARDAPISTIEPSTVGIFGTGPEEQRIEVASADDTLAAPVADSVQVTAGPNPELQLVAVRPAWVRVRSADGSVIYEAIMNAGDTYVVPDSEEAPLLKIGESGAVYFNINGKHYGPVGRNGSVTSKLALAPDLLLETYQEADLESDADLREQIMLATNGEAPAE